MNINTFCPRVVATIGLHGSASTWVFNVVRELMTAVVGEAAVMTVFTDDVRGVPGVAERAGRYLIIKSHTGSADLDKWLAEEHVRIILSVRDPRDACLSVAQRFNLSIESAIHNLAYDCAHLIRLAAEGHAVLRYENRFFEDPGTIRELADWLGLRVAAPTMAAIFERYRTDAVRSFVAQLGDLPAERQGTIRSVLADTVTYYQTGHIGDGRDGKWHDLPPSGQDGLTRMFTPFLDQFGYAR
jgi:hypothetical protein